MRLGILDCHHMPERYRPIAGTYTDMFRAMVAAVDPSIDVVGYDARGGQLPDELDECDSWLLTGSSGSVYDEGPWLADLSDLVRDLHAAHAPTVGVCFGHQLLAHALGGRTERAASGWGVGALPMAVTEPTDWMDPPLAEATLLYSHQDQVTVLPAGTIATTCHPSRDCSVSRSASEPASYDDTLIEENSCMPAPYNALAGPRPVLT